MNRLTRDEIITEALDRLDNPSLDQHDRPSGVVAAGAFSIKWLQRGIDYCYHLYPIAGTIVRDSPLTIGAGATEVLAPTDCLLDYKNGIVIRSDKRRLRRRSWDKILSLDSSRTGLPLMYAFAPQNNAPRFIPWPTPDKTYQAYLTYYALPPVLPSGATVPNFPADECLVEYLHLRGQEWCNAVAKGTALTYLKQMVSELGRAGIGTELEDDEVGTFDLIRPEIGDQAGDAGWMGNVIQ